MNRFVGHDKLHRYNKTWCMDFDTSGYLVSFEDTWERNINQQ